MLLPSKKIYYKGTISGLRISAVDGTAFLDNCSALTTLADGTNEIIIYDSAGAFISAVLKAQGSGETLGDELITSVTNSALPYETLTINVNGKDIDSAINTSGSGLAYTNDNMTLGQLYTLVCDITLNSGDAPSLRSKRGVSSVSNIIKNPLIDGTYYYTANDNDGNLDNGLLVYNTSNSNYSLVWSSKQVLTPSTDGVTLQASKWDATENLGYVNPAFKYNEASYFVQVRKVRG